MIARPRSRLQGKTAADIFDAIQHAPPDASSPAWRYVSPLAQDLLLRILKKDPRERASAADILSHAWMRLHCARGASPRVSVCHTSRRSSEEPIQTLDGPVGSWDTSGRGLGPADSEAATASGPGASGGTEATPSSPPSTLESVASSRILQAPDDPLLRTRLHGFIDCFKRLELFFVRLLEAPDAAVAGVEWASFRVGLRELDAYLAAHGTKGGPYVLGREPSLAEAVTAPALFRMTCCLSALRGLQLQAECEALGLPRLLSWLTEVLDRPALCCDVVALPPQDYVQMARKLHVRYEGPPLPPSPPPNSEGGPELAAACVAAAHPVKLA